MYCSVRVTVECRPGDNRGDKNEGGEMKCAAGEQIAVQSALYGRESSEVCNAGNEEEGGTHKAWRYDVCDDPFDVTELFKSQCDGKTTCKYPITTGKNYYWNLPGYKRPCADEVDPDVGGSKYLNMYNEIKYKCIGMYFVQSFPKTWRKPKINKVSG